MDARPPGGAPGAALVAGTCFFSALTAAAAAGACLALGLGCCCCFRCGGATTFAGAGTGAAAAEGGRATARKGLLTSLGSSLRAAAATPAFLAAAGGVARLVCTGLARGEGASSSASSLEVVSSTSGSCFLARLRAAPESKDEDAGGDDGACGRFLGCCCANSSRTCLMACAFLVSPPAEAFLGNAGAAAAEAVLSSLSPCKNGHLAPLRHPCGKEKKAQTGLPSAASSSTFLSLYLSVAGAIGFALRLLRLDGWGIGEELSGGGGRAAP